jgi:Glycosyl hydrolase catalytic core
MFPSLVLVSSLYLTLAYASTQPTFGSSPKRGLVFTPDPANKNDDKIWTQSGSDLTWYYNYGSQPSPQFASTPQSQFEFVPMIWGAPLSASDNEFLYNVTALINGGRNITHVLAFNEPDGNWQQGGSNIKAADAALAWQREIVPLQKMGVKVGAPAMEFPGLDWLKNFTAACPNCTFDFIPLHFYGDQYGLEWHINEIHTAYKPSPEKHLVSATDMIRYPDTKLWLTEFAYNDASLEKSQAFFNYTIKLLDGLDYVERYSYFGAFRSTKSNVGPNATFLDAKGRLTDIGSWYLGGAATGNTPTGNTPTGNTPTGNSPAGSKASHHRGGVNVVIRTMISAVIAWAMTGCVL